MDLVIDQYTQHFLHLADDLEQVHVQFHLLQFLSVLIDDLYVVEVLLYFGVRVDVDVADVNVHLVDGDVVAAA